MATDSRKNAAEARYSFHRVHGTRTQKPEPPKRKKSGIFAVLTVSSRRP